MDDRGPSESRNHGQSSRSGARRGYTFPRAEHRQPGYGSQAHRDSRQVPYMIGFVVVVAALAAFLYVGLNWATGPGRASGQANPPTLTPIAVIAVVPPTPPPPSPTTAEQIYIVKAGDNPESIANQFGIKTAELIAANNIVDPQKLQIGQTLKIPAPSSGR